MANDHNFKVKNGLEVGKAATITGKLTINGDSAPDFGDITLNGSNPAVYFADNNGSTAWHFGQNGTDLYILEDPDRNGAYNNIRSYWRGNLFKQEGNITASGTITASSFSGDLNYNDITNPPVIDNSVDYINSASFNTGNGVLTLSGVGRAGATVDLDGKYADTNHTHSQYMLKYNGSTTADYDTLLTNGIWRNQGGVNGPEGGTHTTGLVAMQDNLGNYGFQLFSDTNTSGADMYFRNKDTTWGSWNKLWHSNNLNPVTGLAHDTVNTELDVTFADGTTQSLDLSQYIDDTNLARIISGSLDGSGILTVTRDDSTTFTIDLSLLLDDTNLPRIVSAAWNTGNGVLTLTRNDGTSIAVDLDNRYAYASHDHDRLIAIDDRDMKPNTSGVQTNVKAIRAFFSSGGGMTGSANTDYKDVLVLDTYSDSSGGGPNAITFDKGSVVGDPQVHIWKGAWGGTTWGTGQRVFADNYHPNADKWTTARTNTVVLSGDVLGTGSASVDGTGNWTVAISADLNVQATDTFSGTYPIAWLASDNLYKSTWLTINGATDTLNTRSIAANGTITATSFSGDLDYNDITNPPVIDNSVDYINGASFNTSNGVLTLSGVGRAGATVDLDGRYYNTTDSNNRYVLKTGDTMTGNLNFSDDAEGITWNRNTDGASILFYNDSDADTNSRLEFNVRDNGNEFFRWTSNSVEWMKLIGSNLSVGKFDIVAEGTQGTYMKGISSISFNDSSSSWTSANNHGIRSTGANGSFGDDISINSYHDVTIRLDSNSNNSGSYLRVHNDTTAAHSGNDNLPFWTGHDGSGAVSRLYGNVGINAEPRTDTYRLNMGGHVYMNNKHIHFLDEAHFNSNTRFKNSSDSTLLFRAGNTTYAQISMQTGTTTRGSIYVDNSNSIGLVDAGGSWGVKHTNDQGTRFYTDNNTQNAAIGIDFVGGTYGSMVVNSYKNGWAGYSIDNDWVFMSNGTDSGIYNDIDNEWSVNCARNGAVTLYHNGSDKLATLTSGVEVRGDLKVNGHIQQSEVIRPDVKWSASTTSTGQVRIRLPGTSSQYDMVNIHIDVYEYNGDAGSQLVVSGHNWTTGWANTRLTVVGGFTKPVYLVREASDYYILLGDTNSSWQYGSVHVTKVTSATYYNVIDWASGWDITQSTTALTTTHTSGNINTTSSETLKTNGVFTSQKVNALSDIDVGGGLTIAGSLSRGTWASSSNYKTGADNIVLKGNSAGRSGIFFESEKDGTNINHPSDFGFIQYHAYGTSTSGEANELIIGVSNDGDDHVILNAPSVNGLKFRTGVSTTDYTVWHSGNFTPSNYLTSYTETDTLQSVCSRGATTSTNITSTGGRIIINTAGAAYYTADGGTNQWKYLSLQTNGSTKWDIATKDDDASGALQFRPNGGPTNRMTLDTSGNLTVQGLLTATQKSFTIDHPTKEGHKLRYGSLEGPENGVYVRGRLKGDNTIELPDVWVGLVHEDSITVSLTAIGKSQEIWVEDIVDNKVIVGGDNVNCFYHVFAERKDVDKLVTEFQEVE